MELNVGLGLRLSHRFFLVSGSVSALAISQPQMMPGELGILLVLAHVIFLACWEASDNVYTLSV